MSGTMGMALPDKSYVMKEYLVSHWLYHTICIALPRETYVQRDGICVDVVITYDLDSTPKRIVCYITVFGKCVQKVHVQLWKNDVLEYEIIFRWTGEEFSANDETEMECHSFAIHWVTMTDFIMIMFVT